LSHVEWDTKKQHWKHRKPSKMPKLEVVIEVAQEERKSATGALSKQFGLQKPGKVKSWSVVPDTGAQICVGGTVLLNRLNLMERDLIPASQEIPADNEAEMKIMGGVILMVGVINESVTGKTGLF